MRIGNVELVRRQTALGMLDLTMGYPKQFAEGLELAQKQFQAGSKALTT